jgi:hypothetical protein
MLLIDIEIEAPTLTPAKKRASTKRTAVAAQLDDQAANTGSNKVPRVRRNTKAAAAAVAMTHPSSAPSRRSTRGQR